jgi:hypothetical protein
MQTFYAFNPFLALASHILQVIIQLLSLLFANIDLSIHC